MERKMTHVKANQSGAIVIGGHFQGLGVIRSLGRHGVPVMLMDKELTIGRFSRYLSKFYSCPDIKNESRFLQCLIDLAVKHGKKGWVVFPTDDETVYFLSRFRHELTAYFRITTPGWEVIKYTHDKKNTYQMAEAIGVPTPKTFYPKNGNDLSHIPFDFPVVLKPSVVKNFFNVTKTKAYIACNFEELKNMYGEMLKVIDPFEVMVQEFIPGGPEHLYSFCPLVKNGEIVARVVARRARQHPMDFGHASTFAETVHIPELDGLSRKLLDRIRYEGLAEVEYKYDPGSGAYKLLDINARVWGWHTLAIRAGIDLPYLLFQTMLGENVLGSDFRDGVKWMRLVTDVPTAILEVIKKRMKLGSYLKSFIGPTEFAVWSKNDMLPFLAELLLLPYLYQKRGF